MAPIALIPPIICQAFAKYCDPMGHLLKVSPAQPAQGLISYLCIFGSTTLKRENLRHVKSTRRRRFVKGRFSLQT